MYCVMTPSGTYSSSLRIHHISVTLNHWTLFHFVNKGALFNELSKLYRLIPHGSDRRVYTFLDIVRENYTHPLPPGQSLLKIVSSLYCGCICSTSDRVFYWLWHGVWIGDSARPARSCITDLNDQSWVRRRDVHHTDQSHKRREFYVLIGFLRSLLLRWCVFSPSRRMTMSSHAYLWIWGNHHEWMKCEWENATHRKCCACAENTSARVV